MWDGLGGSVSGGSHREIGGKLDRPCGIMTERPYINFGGRPVTNKCLFNVDSAYPCRVRGKRELPGQGTSPSRDGTQMGNIWLDKFLASDLGGNEFPPGLGLIGFRQPRGP